MNRESTTASKINQKHTQLTLIKTTSKLVVCSDPRGVSTC